MQATSRIREKAAVGPDAAEIAVVRAARQALLFAPAPRRADLLGADNTWPLAPITVAIHRNMPFEFVASAMPAFLGFAGFRVEFRLGAYDDSLSFPARDADSDLHLVWLDFDRYETGTDIAAWLAGRLAVLRGGSAAPILVADHPLDRAFNDRLVTATAALPGVRLYPRSAIAEGLGAAFQDSRMARITGTSLSDRAQIALARDLGLVWFPGSLRPRLKALILDLDNTLYDGVLGEDGVAGVTLGPAHRALQERILALHREGLFLAVLSRNEPADVEALFETRTDFPLRREHVSAVAAGWVPKSQLLQGIARTLRIGPEAMLFIDDNLGEIAEVGGSVPEIRTLHATDAASTAVALGLYPGLRRFAAGETDALRTHDLAMAETRIADLAAAADPAAYLASLGITLTYERRPRARRGRLAELSGKTNQFNLSLSRLSEAAVAARLDDPACEIVAIRLADRMSDSGVIAGLFARRDGGALLVEELVVSCRALGRGIEDAMIATALLGIVEAVPVSSVAFVHATGPRNAPGREWLSGFCGVPLAAPEGLASIGIERLRRLAGGGAPLTILWASPEPEICA